MHGVILDKATLDRDDLDFSPLLALLPKWTLFDQTHPADLDEHIGDAEIILTNKVTLDHGTLQRHPRIRLICVLATGTNNIDLDAANELGIDVRNVTAYGSRSVTQHVFLLILSLARRQRQYVEAVEQGRWSRSEHFCLLDYPIEDISGKTLGIIGYGELGRAVAKMAEAFGMETRIAERAGRPPRPGRLPLQTVIGNADILSLHCPLTPETANMINADTLNAMKDSAWLINTARGGLVDAPALVNALDHGIIAAAALDVLATEPPPADHPLLARPRDNLIITPHIAWAARSARQRIIELTCDNIRAFLNSNQQPRP